MPSRIGRAKHRGPHEPHQGGNLSTLHVHEVTDASMLKGEFRSIPTAGRQPFLGRKTIGFL